jgi:hypothetical protein
MGTRAKPGSAVDAIDQRAAGAPAFDQRCGLLERPTLLRFRVLDDRLRIHGLSERAFLLDGPRDAAQLAGAWGEEPDGTTGHRLSVHVRLEQERIPFGHVERALESLLSEGD